MARFYSQNGYAAKDSGLIAQYTVPGTGIEVNLRKGDVSVVLLYLMEQYAKTVETLQQKDTGSYNPRSVIGGKSLSNHASGTAVDLRWNDHPLGKRGTFNSKEKAALRKILNFLEGVVRWGGDYRTRADEMHFEIHASPSRVKVIADKIRRSRQAKPVAKKATPPKRPTPTIRMLGDLKKGQTSTDIKNLQRDLNKVFPAYRHTPLKVDGVFGANTEGAVKEFQDRSGLRVDGIVGANTKAALRRHGIIVRG